MYKLSSPASWEKICLGDEGVFLVIRSRVNVRHRLSRFSFCPVLRKTFPLTGELLKSHLSTGKLLKWKDWKGAPTKPLVTVAIALNSATSPTFRYQSETAEKTAQSLFLGCPFVHQCAVLVHSQPNTRMSKWGNTRQRATDMIAAVPPCIVANCLFDGGNICSV